jgi:L-ascorbate metabolism protein UlaG (beta-lactamase superfamily)
MIVSGSEPEQGLKRVNLMKIKWLGHSCFLITSEEELKIITDPYVTGHLDINYSKIDEYSDIVVVSHNHEGHNNIGAVKGSPAVVKGIRNQEVRGIEFKGLASFHDATQGKQRGLNTIFCFTVNGIRICHLGDLGHQPSDRQLGEIGRVDLLLIPTGAGSTIGPAQATLLCNRIKARVVIPMHFKTSKCTFLPAEADDFIRGKPNVKKIDVSEVEFKKDSLTVDTEIIVLNYAL